jgi:2-hydroxychromene-2-carboxylate isomerase
MAGSSTADAPQARFFYDFASAEAYLAAEHVNSALAAVPEWVPIDVGPPAFRCAAEIDAYREDVERRAAALGLQALRWPGEYPFDTRWALLAATYAKSIGRGVAFSLAAFRQAYAGGRDLSDRDSVLIAAAACEMHPAAVIRGAGMRATAERLDAATAAARAAGVRDVPALVTAEGEVDDLSELLRGAARR